MEKTPSGNNKFYKQTGRGIYVDLQTNLIEIIKREMRDRKRIRRIEPKGYEGNTPFFDMIPDLPYLYVYIEGGEKMSNSLGRGQGHRVKTHRQIYVHFYYILKEAESKDAHVDALEAAYHLEEIIQSNINVNDMFGGNSEYVETSIEEKYFGVGKELRLVKAVHMKAIYEHKELSVNAKRKLR